jgi:hypothetical protein
MLKRLFLCLFLLTAASPAIAVVTVIDYTDIYYLAAESGYGFNVVQNGNFLFVTFFIYGPDKQPTWYTAQLTLDVSGNFNGGLYATTGTYYGLPWNPSDHPDATQVGTASFQPTSPYTAKFTYTVTSPPALAATFAKELQRQSLIPINLRGPYVGGQSGVISLCQDITVNKAYLDKFTLQVTQATSVDVTFHFTYDSGLDCTLSGTLVQYGQLYTVPTASYQCTYGLSTNASMSQIKATSLGIEGKFSAPSVGDGCREDATFGGPLQ